MDSKRREFEQQPGFKPEEEDKGVGSYSPKPYGPGKNRDTDLEEEGIDLERPERDLVERPRDSGTAKPSGSFEDERSDRESSGRPVQLEAEQAGSRRRSDRNRQPQPGGRQQREQRGARPSRGDRQGRADKEPGISGTQQEPSHSKK